MDERDLVLHETHAGDVRRVRGFVDHLEDLVRWPDAPTSFPVMRSPVMSWATFGIGPLADSEEQPLGFEQRARVDGHEPSWHVRFRGPGARRDEWDLRRS